MSHSKYDVVDVHVSSTKPLVDAILEHPILDGTQKYSIEVTEFVCPLSAEPPLIDFDTVQARTTSYLLNVRRKTIYAVGNQPNTRLSNVPTIGPLLQPLEYFFPDQFKPISSVNDLVFYMQVYFDNIKGVYGNSVGGIVADEHAGNSPDDDTTPAVVQADSWVQVRLTPNGTLQLYMSNLFCTNFWIDVSKYSMKLFGFEENIIAFRAVGGAIQSGLLGLTGSAVVGANNIVDGAPGETILLQCKYSLFNNFDHRMNLDIDSGGMPIPNVINWLTSNRQGLRHSLATFPVSSRTVTSLHMNRHGAGTGLVSFRSEILQGDIVWRRAESKISERFEILNSQFFQNIRLEVYIERRVWDHRNPDQGYTFQRSRIRLNEGDSWTAKLRFRTLTK